MIEVNNTLPAIWDSYVKKHSQSTLYHLYHWGNLLQEVFGFRRFYLSYQKDGKLAGLLPMLLMENFILGKKLYSMPVLDYGGILADSVEIEQALARKAVKIGQKYSIHHIQLRHFEEKKLDGFISQREKITFFLDLTPPLEETWKNLKGAVRRSVRKARKQNFNIQFGKSNFLKKFYRIFCKTMHSHGTPVYSFQFFQKIFQKYPQHSHIALVFKDQKAVAGALFFSFQGKSEAPFVASLPELSFRPNDFLYWNILKFCKNQKDHLFDFGRCSPDSGTYRFKKKWTLDERKLVWQYYLLKDSIPPKFGSSNSSHQKIIQLWKKLPLWFVNGVGPIISRNIP